MRAVAALTSVLATVAARPVRAQAVSGRVVDARTGSVIPAAPVRLLRAAPGDTTAPADTTPVAAGVTGPDGVFTLPAPGPGTYRTRIGDVFVTRPLTLATADSVDMREYRLSALPVAACASGPSRAALDSLVRGGAVLCESQVERVAQMVPGTLLPVYPAELRASNLGGHVVAQFVVDTTGRADLGTFRVLETTNDAFVRSVRTALATARFYPAEVAHHKVRQLVRLPLTFAIAGRAPGIARPYEPPPMFPPPFRPIPNPMATP